MGPEAQYFGPEPLESRSLGRGSTHVCAAAHALPLSSVVFLGPLRWHICECRMLHNKAGVTAAGLSDKDESVPWDDARGTVGRNSVGECLRKIVVSALFTSQH